MNTATILLGKRYMLREVLGVGAMGMVYRAIDRLNGQSVALKLVTSPDYDLESTRSSEDIDLRLTLAHEFGVLASLRHPNIISVLDYGFDAQQQPYFTMEYLEKAQNVRAAGVKASLSTKITLLFQILQALAYLHRRGIVHRDLKPANVMVVNGQVKVLDFGLAARRDERDETGGTLAYMAPELLLGIPASVSSDLYAVGVTAYELFSGELPFWSESFSEIVNDIRTKLPDLTALGAEAPLSHVVERLLAKNPADRYDSALEAIDALSKATGQAHPVETEAIRDSFLQAAQFVGRDNELGALTGILNRVAIRQEPAGAIWLLGGESGVGKSRLLDEVRVQALVHGALVLRGQALDAGGDVYQVWRAVLRWLVVLVDLTELEASVLGLLVPDISTLLGNPVRPAPELNPDATQTRLFKVIEDVITRYIRGATADSGPQNPLDGPLQPLVIILEDLQWAGESLALLNSLKQAAQQLPLLIIGSYRSEEAADIPARVPNASLLLLERLTKHSIADLSASMLGENGRNPELVALLERETEGNVFFMIQILRTLAEETGQLDQIGTRTLPATVAAGGLQRAVQRRIERIPPAARPLLQVAAVAGRELDLPLLRAILSDRTVVGDTDLGLWLLTCANVGILEVREERWRFTHDKLREGVLADLAVDSRRSLHRAVAQALEQTDPQAVGRLAYHWQMAGDDAKEREYAILAGRQAIVNGAYHQAVAYLERALAIAVAMQTEETTLALATLLYNLAYSYLGLDHTLQTRKYSAQGVAQLGYPMPEGRTRILLTLAAVLLRQGWHRLRPTRYGPALAADLPLNAKRRRQLQAAKIYQLHWVSSYFLNDSLNAILASLLSLNLAEQAGIRGQFGSTYAGAALATSLLLPPRVSEFYVRMALIMAEDTEDANGSADALNIGGLVSAGRADWATAEKALDRSIALHLSIGDLVRWQYSLNIQVEIAYYQAQYARSLALNDESFAASLKYDFGQVHTWGLRRRAMNLFRLGQVEDAAQCLMESMPYYARHTDTLNETNAYGLLASVRLRQGQLEEALEAADSAAALVGNSAPLGYYLMDGYVGIAEVRFALWSAEPDNPVLRKAAWQASANLQRYGQIFPVGRARAALFLGRYNAIQGKMQRAQAIWQVGLNTAQKLVMPYEEGLALYALGCSQSNPDARREQLTQAAAIFSKIGTPYELELARRALRETAPE